MSKAAQVDNTANSRGHTENAPTRTKSSPVPAKSLPTDATECTCRCARVMGIHIRIPAWRTGSTSSARGPAWNNEEYHGLEYNFMSCGGTDRGPAESCLPILLKKSPFPPCHPQHVSSSRGRLSSLDAALNALFELGNFIMINSPLDHYLNPPIALDPALPKVPQNKMQKNLLTHDVSPNCA